MVMAKYIREEDMKGDEQMYIENSVYEITKLIAEAKGE